MEDYPHTQLEFEERFASEESCREYIFRLRWPDGFRCPRCDGEKAWLTSRQLYHCAGCALETSITAGTIFQDTRKPLRVWFRAIWYVVGQKNGVSALGVQRVLGLKRYETVWIWLHKLRTAMVRPGRERLSGTVEMDETFIGGKRPGKRGRGAEGKSIVIVVVEDKGNRIGRVRLRRVANAAGESLIPTAEECVEPGSAIRTDAWSGYNRLAASGYEHIVANESANVGENLLPLAHRVAALLKRWLLGTHQGAVRASHLDYYLDEYTFRFNRRASRSRGKLFYRLLQQAVALDPVRGHEIHGGRNDRPKPQDIGVT